MAQRHRSGRGGRCGAPPERTPGSDRGRRLSLRRDPARAVRRAFLALSAATAACGPEPGLVPVACAARTDADSAAALAPLEVRVHVDEAPSARPLTLLVRVDPLAEPGAVLFEPDVPRTAAAVALTLTPEAVFQGCVGERPSGFDLRLPRAPRDRLWLRISSDRSVAVTLTASAPAPGGPSTPAESAPREARILVEPGASGRTSWDPTPEGRE